jgi:glutamate--cysteine ligase
LSFRDLLDGKLPGHGNLRATRSDWVNHVSSIFPEVRLKRYLEMRGADSGPWARLTALPAFWVGILYDDASLDAAWDLVKGWSAQERQKLRDDVPRAGFSAEIRGRTMLDLARECLALAEAGLRRRNFRDSDNRDETRYLSSLQETVARGTTPAEELLEKYNGAWGKSVEPVFTECAY